MSSPGTEDIPGELRCIGQLQFPPKIRNHQDTHDGVGNMRRNATGYLSELGPGFLGPFRIRGDCPAKQSLCRVQRLIIAGEYALQTMAVILVGAGIPGSDSNGIKVNGLVVVGVLGGQPTEKP